jgi:hypothetical protein
VSNTRPAESSLSCPITRWLTMCLKRKAVVSESFCNGLRLHGIEIEEKKNAANEGAISTAAGLWYASFTRTKNT